MLSEQNHQCLITAGRRFKTRYSSVWCFTHCAANPHRTRPTAKCLFLYHTDTTYSDQPIHHTPQRLFSEYL